MDAHERYLLDGVIAGSGAKFTIPVYQRNYEWEEENLQQLFDDIVDLVDSDLDKRHFIGTLCLKTEQKYNNIIIDGQQRITTTTILLKALHDIVTDPYIKRDIREKYLINRYKNVEENKLFPSEIDKAAFNKIMEITVYNPQPSNEKEQKSKFYSAYLFFRNKIQQLFNETGTSEEDFFDAIKGLYVVEMQLDNDEDAQAIFESLNSKGLGLSTKDLLRNYILMSLPYSEQEVLYKKYWYPIEVMLGENVQDFVLHYLLAKRGTDQFNRGKRKTKTSNSNLYLSFKKYMESAHINKENLAEIESLLQDMTNRAINYKSVLDLSKNKKSRLYDIVNTLEQKTYFIPLMYLYQLKDEGKITEEEIAKVVNIFYSVAMRKLVCRVSATNNQYCAAIVQQLRILNAEEYTSDDVCDIIKTWGGQNAAPNDVVFAECLRTQPIYISLKSKKCRHFMYELHKHKRKEIILDENISIEHIMPQTLSEEWLKQLQKDDSVEKHEHYLHTIGNLALTGHNSELSNNTFADKKEIYRNSAFLETKALADIEEWNIDAIKERAENLIKIALEVWSLPTDIFLAENSTTYTEAYHLENASVAMKSLYEKMKSKILTLGGVTVEFKKKYITFKYRLNVCDIVVQPNKLKLIINMKQGTLKDPQGLTRDVSGIGHWGNGDYQVTVTDNKMLDEIFTLIVQSYDNQK